MSDIVLEKSKLKGSLIAPPSKSVAHRALICAALAGNSAVNNIELSNDILATLDALRDLGFEFINTNNSVVFSEKNIKEKCIINCFESGSTLRFLIPLAAALGVNAAFIGEGRLPERPINEYVDLLSDKGIDFTLIDGKLPLKIKGKMKSGIFSLKGDVSSQYITGLLLSFPIINSKCEIVLTSKLQSAPYVDITIDVMKKFGVNVNKTENGFLFSPSQEYKPCEFTVEGDYSQAAFWICANALGAQIEVLGLNKNSSQGDKEIIKIIELFGNTKERTIDASQIPDLVPIISVLASLSLGKTNIINAGRLKLKESNRLLAVETSLKAIGANIKQIDDGLLIEGKEELDGGEASSFNDHRIVMALAIAALKCNNNVKIQGVEAVNKSYPRFFEEYKQLGGKIL